MWIVKLALRRPYTFTVLALLILILGPIVILRTPTDVFPNIDIPVVSIVWNYTGLSADDMVSTPVGAVLAMTLLLLVGCSVGPRYARPSAPESPQFKELPPSWKTAQPNDHLAKGKWWEVFQDPQLNQLEEQINISNQTLKAAQAQFEQARALVRVNRAGYYPTITAGVGASRNRVSTARPNGQFTSTNPFTDLTLPVDLSYEVDVWGRVRHTVQAARANAQATAADLETVSLSVHAELAADYFQLRTFDADAQLLDSTVASYTRALELTQSRYGGGVASQVDVAQAQTQLETTRALAIDVRVARAQFEHASSPVRRRTPMARAVSS